MYSKLLRFIYSCTYYIHVGIVGEIYKVSKCGFLPDFNSDWSCWKCIYAVGCIHFPLLFVILCLVVALLMVKHCKKLAPNTMKLHCDEAYGLELMYTGTQALPYITFIFREQWFGIWCAITVLFMTLCFLISHGTYNLTLMFLGYKQYRVQAASSSYWMISKRRISNFTSSEVVYKLQDNVVIRYE